METSTVDIWNAVGTWISGLGTIGAVITSLWLANNNNKIKLKIKVNSSILIDTFTKEKQEVCHIEIVNICTRNVKINAIGWEIKRGKIKQNFYQKTDGSLSAKLPLTLNEGEDISIALDFKHGDWLKSMAKHLKGYDIKDLKLIVVTNIENFKCNIDNSLIEALKQERKRLADMENN